MEVILKIFAFLTGAVWGSFLNVIIYRVPEGLSIIKPRSFCPKCKNPIKWYDNIPLLSYLLLRGRCRYCGNRIPFRYFAVEFITAISFLIALNRFSHDFLELFRAFVFLSLLIVLAGIDYERFLLPDVFTIPGTAAGLALSLFLPPGFKASLLGAVLGYLSLWIIYKAFLLLTGKEGLGFGDFKMFAMIGAFLGAGKLLIVALLASLFGLAVAMGLILARKLDFKSMIPFGIFLSAASWVVYLFRFDMIELYKRLSLL